MNIERIAAFSDNGSGGNPAGVVILNEMPSEMVMHNIAADVGYSETAFAVRHGNPSSWRVRYFTPESEIAFCGHATIALGAELAKRHGAQQYALKLNQNDITVIGREENGMYSASLQSPKTHSSSMSDTELNHALELFGLSMKQLSSSIKPARIHGGVDHFLIPLENKHDLATMQYQLELGQKFMLNCDVITIMLVVQESEDIFHARNAFASSGVYEDPATGAAAAAFSGYLRDTNINTSGELTIVQGEYMGARSIINTQFSPEKGSAISVSGTTRKIS